MDTPIRECPTRGMTLAERLEFYTDRDTPTEHGCWLWTGGVDIGGYGELSMGGRGKHRKAHIVAWELATGQKVPHGKILMHFVCDTPACVRHDHLKLGTTLENNRDCRSKGRTNPARGSRHGLAILDEDKVAVIKAALRGGGVHADLARLYGVSVATISNINTGKSWTHVP